MKASDIHLRDPFVFVEDGVYYLYGTAGAHAWQGRGEGFGVYTSPDMREWSSEGRVFAPSPGFWGTENFWAPELHRYRGGYYLFASFKAPLRRRATAILRADGPLGPFCPWGEDQVTPRGWECLDGTLYVDGDGLPWLVFCHEWVQKGGGTMCVQRLREDLTGPLGEPATVFAAADARWTKAIRSLKGVKGHVTDGPYLIRPGNGQLWMLWSSITKTGYGIGLAVSESGGILGPWKQQDEPLFRADGGHGMVFRALDGQDYLAIHAPNIPTRERPVFLPIRETDSGLELMK